MVGESAREVPVAYEVDVVVVGGSAGAVAAAAEAARSGATVFLAAPRTYLGDDVCGPMRLWLEPDEEPATPLAEAVYAEPPGGGAAAAIEGAVDFTYEADRPSAGVHKDTRPPSLLADGRWASAARESVQYDGDVAFRLDLGQARRVRKVHVFAYQRPDGFEVARVAVSTSLDGRSWQPVSAIANDRLDRGRVEEAALDLAARVDGTARYLRLDVAKTERAGRVLLGEIVVEADGAADEKPEPKRVRRPPTPMQVKRVLDKALLDAGVRFLFGCYPTDVLVDATGRPAGIVMANRSGRQAVLAKVVLDATDRATVARLAGAEFAPYPAGEQVFERVVVGGGPRPGEGLEARTLPAAFPARVTGKRGRAPQAIASMAVRYTLRIPMADGSWSSLARAEQVARDRTFHPEQLDASERPFQVPPDPMKGRASVRGPWPGAAGLDLEALRPAGVERMWVLGGCADVSREAAGRLLRPVELMALGERVGREVAREAKQTARPRGVRVASTAAGEPAETGDVREVLTGVRPVQEGLPTVPSPARGVPVIGRYEVVVVGGGTGGAPAGIAAARAGAKTLVVEFLHGLGGVSTMGLIGKYYHGYRGGFTAEIDRGVAELGARVGVVGKMEWYRREVRQAGGDVWFHTLGCGAFVEDGTVKGVVVATPEGRGVVLADVVIDSTGNADVAIAAGADYEYTSGEHAALQGVGLPPLNLGASYTNTDYTFADEADAVDVWHLLLSAREQFAGAYDLAQIIDSRERRRIVGDVVLSPLDILNRRTWPDTVVLAKSDFDSHGFTVHPVFLLKAPSRGGEDLVCHMPYRCLLPRGLDGILVTGLGVSVHRDAIPIVRMQPDIQNQGYAAGRAAATAAASAAGTREIDLDGLQRHLVEKECLPASVLKHGDSYPLPGEEVERAVAAVAAGKAGHPELAVVLAQPETSVPMLREACAAAEDDAERLACAHVLGMMGDATGAEALIEKVRGTPWDRGWNFRGMGQYGASISPLDSHVVALGRTRAPGAVEAVLAKVGELGDGPDFSHCRAVAMALETLADRRAAKPLAELLARPGMTGHALDVAPGEATPQELKRGNRNAALRELVLARALYRCGDWKGLGEKVLRAYERDPRGHYARHAHAVLEEGKRVQ